jgi:cell division septal protein FtsQ
VAVGVKQYENENNFLFRKEIYFTKIGQRRLISRAEVNRKFSDQLNWVKELEG